MILTPLKTPGLVWYLFPWPSEENNSNLSWVFWIIIECSLPCFGACCNSVIRLNSFGTIAGGAGGIRDIWLLVTCVLADCWGTKKKY